LEIRYYGKDYQRKEMTEMEKQWTCREDILCGINEPRDRDNLTDLEKKHIPVIDAPDKVKKDEAFNIKIEAGLMLEHPNEPAHFIEWVELYCGDTFFGRVNFSGGLSFPQASFRVKLSHAHGPIKVRVRCNLHGLWESTKEITVG
jgi:superoxide reductase